MEVFDTPASAIAIIGMSCRFPGARNIEEFWQNLQEGKESIRFFTREELEQEGLPAALLNNPHYIRAHGMLEDIDLFDASFFDYSPKEAELADPQQRLLLECVWEALEHAGYSPRSMQQPVALFAGASLSSYYTSHILQNYGVNNALYGLQISLGNEANFLTTRISYKLNLQGPSVCVSTACSTSLVAVHMACQSLLYGESDVALAGGVSLLVPQKAGYVYEPGGIASPDGHCRAFDEQAQGAVSGSGAGVVVLKRLEDALRDNDTIHAVIRGTALNNDGAVKAGFTAPGVEAQTRVVAEALAMAEVDARSISYIETHGTGTTLGDPIEIAALHQAFHVNANAVLEPASCAIGSVKTNIGHLDVASGIAGLLKTVLLLSQKKLVPSLHFTRPNAAIDFASGPFYVNTELRDWETEALPRRAGVSSFGIGGTNVHVVLEEAPPVVASTPQEAPQLLLFSAKSQKALDTVTAATATYIQVHPAVDLADIAYTTQVGRQQFPYRRAVVCTKGEEAVLQLQFPRKSEAVNETHPTPVIFLFSGQGTQYRDMGKDLYREGGIFRETVDDCAGILQALAGWDIRQIFYPDAGDEHEDLLRNTAFTQPALFVLEYALAQVWVQWGIRPQAMIGHSLGEYVAACIAGVFSLDDALRVVYERGRLAQTLPEGAMLTCMVTEDIARSFQEEDVALAAVNLPSLCVLSGSAAAIERVEQRLTRQGKASSRLPIARAFHTPAMHAISAALLEVLSTVTLNPPQIPYISNVSGTWISAEEATDPRYWSQHLCEPVRFSAGLQELFTEEGQILLEIGPGQTLSSFVRQHPGRGKQQQVVASLRDALFHEHDMAFLLNSLGQIWVSGGLVKWPVPETTTRRRIALPTYPFEKTRHWLEALPRNQEQKQPAAVIARNEPVTSEQQERSFPMQQQSERTERSPRREKIRTILKSIITDLSGYELQEGDSYISFIEKGFDSLFLLQISQAIFDRLGVQIALQQLFEDIPTVDAIAAYVDELLPAEALREEIVAATPVISAEQDLGNDPAFQPVAVSGAGGELSRSAVERLLTRQLDLMEKQLQLLRSPGSPQAETAAAGSPKQVNGSGGHRASEAREARNNGHVRAPQLDGSRAGFLPFRPLNTELSAGLTDVQRTYIEGFIQRYTERTQASKAHNQTYRAYLADPRASTGFKRRWKEIVYPLVSRRSEGAYLWDIDDNKYIDYTMGFGVHLFGHTPSFVLEALEQQLREGMHLGPQSFLAGEVARLICAMTGMERAIFCNSGTEAVMAALRVARTVTGRTKIVLFAGSYHGTYDGTLARAAGSEAFAHILPQVPGIPQGMVDDVIVLEYDTAASLEWLRQHASELAAVLAEPIQSRRPDVQPRAFLSEVRAITEQTGTLLIFDEMITGFRLSPGGVQEVFGIQADIATYGKVIGGGMPIGVVAARGTILDALDGGMWNFGDASFPQALQTAFAGTFCKHPLAMAATLATLAHLKDAGPALQQRLNQQTESLVRQLNDLFAREQAPLKAVHCGSLFLFEYAPTLPFGDLFFYHLVQKGIYLWEGRTCFLSTAHSDEDRLALVFAVEEVIHEMRAGDLLPFREPVGPASGKEQSYAWAPLTDAQKQIWASLQVGDEASWAYNECDILRIRGPLQLTTLKHAIQTVVDRHDALRATFSPIGDRQFFAPSLQIDIPYIDLSPLDATLREQRLNTLLVDVAREPFDLVHGPVFRASVVCLAEQEHYLLLNVHHLVMDTWSYGVLVRELCTIYAAECQGIEWHLPEAMQFASYAHAQARGQNDAQFMASEAYWLQQFAETVPVLALPGDLPRPATRTYKGELLILALEQDLYAGLKQVSAKSGCTLYMTMLAVFDVLLHFLTAQEEFIVGLHVSEQSSVGGNDLVGYCINVLPLRNRVEKQQAFQELLRSVKTMVMGAYTHAKYPYVNMMRKVKPVRETGRAPLISAVMNLDRSGISSRLFGVDVESLPRAAVSAKWDLSLNALQTEDALWFECIYSTDVFQAQTIATWLDWFHVLLQRVVSQPEIAIHDLLQLLREQQLAVQEKAREQMHAKSQEKMKLTRRKTLVHERKNEG